MFADQFLRELSALFSTYYFFVYLNTNTNPGTRPLVHVTDGKIAIHAIPFHRLGKIGSERNEQWIR